MSIIVHPPPLELVALLFNGILFNMCTPPGSSSICALLLDPLQYVHSSSILDMPLEWEPLQSWTSSSIVASRTSSSMRASSSIPVPLQCILLECLSVLYTCNPLARLSLLAVRISALPTRLPANHYLSRRHPLRNLPKAPSKLGPNS